MPAQHTRMSMLGRTQGLPQVCCMGSDPRMYAAKPRNPQYCSDVCRLRVNCARSVMVSYKPPMLVTRVQFPACACRWLLLLLHCGQHMDSIVQWHHVHITCGRK